MAQFAVDMVHQPHARMEVQKRDKLFDVSRWEILRLSSLYLPTTCTRGFRFSARSRSLVCLIHH